MKTKFIFLIHLICIFSDILSAQEINQGSIRFKDFISIFPKRDYPFTISMDDKKSTPFVVPLDKIPDDLYKLYFCNQGLQCKSDYCPDSKFLGFRAFGIFPSSKKFELILMAYEFDIGCEEKWLLVTYDTKGSLIDKLLVFANSFIELPKDNDPVSHTYTVEGTILKDTIITERQEKTYNKKTKEKVVNKTKNTYIINPKGQFVKVKAK
jgi:hypothetical protein